MTDDVELARRYLATGDRRLRNELVERHRSIADHAARRYRNRGIAEEDLRQAALLAMVRAVDRFDPDRGVTFSTFANRTVEGELKRALRDRAWAVRPPRAAQERYLALRRYEEELTHSLGRAPTVTELATALGCSVDEVLDAVEVGGARTAGAITRPDDDGVEVEVAAPLQVAELGFGRAEDAMVVAELLEHLDDRSREVLRLRYFERLGQEEIAQRIGVSQSYLSRMIRKILGELRQQLAEHEGGEAVEVPERVAAEPSA